MSVRSEWLECQHIRAARAYDDALRHLLGQWVSELEPVIMTNLSGWFLGLGFAGQVILPARIDLCVAYNGEVIDTVRI